MKRSAVLLVASSMVACLSDDSPRTTQAAGTTDPPPMCAGASCCGAPAAHVGEVRGDIGSDQVVFHGAGSQVVWGAVTEGSGNDVITDLDMSFAVTLEPGAPDVPFRLTAISSCDGAQYGEADAVPYAVRAGWPGVLGTDDSRIVMFKVEQLASSSTATTPWTLTLSGATGIPPMDACTHVTAPAPIACADDPTCPRPPPPVPGAPPGAAQSPLVLAIDTLRLGDADPNGVPSSVAWSHYGYNLDGLHFSASCSPGHCTVPPPSEHTAPTPDGPGGLDNAFGQNALPTYLGLIPDFPSRVGAGISGGAGTTVLVLPALDGMANQTLGAPVPAATVVAVAGVDDGKGGVVPPGADWSSYAWRSRTDVPASTFGAGYVTGNTWVSGEGTLTLQLMVSGVPMVLHVHRAIVTLPLDAARTKGTNGIIAGVLDTEEYLADANAFMKAYAANVLGECPGSSVSSGILDALRVSSDMMKDGTQSSQTCDGISIALGFDARVAKLDTATAPAVVLPKICK